MPNVINCPACRHELQVPNELLGQLVKCPMCGKTFTAPATFEEPAPSSLQQPSEAPGSGAGPTGDGVAGGGGGTPIRKGFRCPFCQTEEKPITRQQIALAGWIVFAVLLFTGCLPLFWIGLLIKEDVRICRECGKKLSDTSI